MAKIYTRTGDDGTTGLYRGGRVPKHSKRIEAYGTVDELNSLLGVVRSLRPPALLDHELARLQGELFSLGADLSTVRAASKTIGLTIGPREIKRLEETIDDFEKPLAPLKVFILPGGSRVAAELHVARTVCRRAERRVTALLEETADVRHAVVYLNRLSDLLFVLARWANHEEKTAETTWHAGTTGQP